MVSGKIKQLIIENGVKKICLCVVGGILFFGSIVYEYAGNTVYLRRGCGGFSPE